MISVALLVGRIWHGARYEKHDTPKKFTCHMRDMMSYAMVSQRLQKKLSWTINVDILVNVAKQRNHHPHKKKIYFFSEWKQILCNRIEPQWLLPHMPLNVWWWLQSPLCHICMDVSSLPWTTPTLNHWPLEDITIILKVCFFQTHFTEYSISQEICTRVCCALLCCGYAIVHNEFTWSIYPYSSGLLCWHWGNR